MQELTPETAPSPEGGPRAPSRTCPECGTPLLHTNGCVLCVHCGYSPCD